MQFLRDLYKRLEGCDNLVGRYDTVLEKLRCTSYEVPDPDYIVSKLLSCSFARKSSYGHVLAACCENGQIIIVNTKLVNSKSPDYYTISDLHNNALFSAAWSEIDMRLVTTSGDHSVGLWNVHDDGTLSELDSFKAHRCSVKTACFRPQDSNVFATGGRDGDVYVWDARNRSKGPEQSIMNCHKASNKHETTTASVTWLVFQDEIKLISCADIDTNINIWDLRKTYLRTMEKPKPLYQLPSPKKNSLKGYSHMVINKNATKLFASCFNSTIYTFNISSYSPVPGHFYSGHSVSCCYDKITLSPDEKYLASTDNMKSNIFIWRLDSSGDPVIKLRGQLEGLSDVSWCPEDNLMLATSSDHPFPWLWTIPTAGYENDLREKGMLSHTYSSNSNDSTESESNVFSFAESYNKKVPSTSKRIPAMAAKSLRNAEIREISSMLMLPNTVVDGYQTHICTEIKKHVIAKNWLTDIHNQQIRKLVVDKHIRRGVKRKRSTSMSPCNNLTRFLKRTNENTD